MRKITPAQRAALKARKRELRRRLKEKQRGRRDLSRRRRRSALMVLLIVLIILLLPLRDCSCAEPEAVVEVEPVVELEEPVEDEVEEPAPRPKPLGGRIARRDRPAYEGHGPEPLPWLAAFRLQVSARSPRLAACFVGTDGPGRLKWTTTVEPTQGVVSDHVLEPVLQSPELTGEQRGCVLEVLEEPRYHLAAGEGSRVSLVIEF